MLYYALCFLFFLQGCNFRWFSFGRMLITHLFFAVSGILDHVVGNSTTQGWLCVVLVTIGSYGYICTQCFPGIFWLYIWILQFKKFKESVYYKIFIKITVSTAISYGQPSSVCGVHVYLRCEYGIFNDYDSKHVLI